MRLSAQSRRYAVLTAVLFLAWNPSFGVTKILVFPLVNKSQEKTLEWLVPLVPEIFCPLHPPVRRLSGARPGVSVSRRFRRLDHGFGQSPQSSLAAVGVEFRVRRHVLRCQRQNHLRLRAVLVRNDRPVKKLITESASPDSLQQLCFSLFAQYMAFTGITLTKEQSREFRRPLSQNPQAYATYVAGYGYEMRSNTSAAITSYARAAEYRSVAGSGVGAHGTAVPLRRRV